MKPVAFALALCCLAASAHAVPKKSIPLSVESDDEGLPIPPIPPSLDTEFLAAPVPNSGITAPRTQSTQGPEWSPGFYNPKDYNIGQGYLPGSTVQGEQDHRARPMPKLQLKVPLE